MGSTLVLICLMLSLSIAVIFPEMKYSQTSNTSISSEFEYMVNKQRKGFLILGLLNSKILSPLNNAWFKFGIFLGKFISPLVMDDKA